MNGLAPNCGVKWGQDMSRNGRVCQLPALKEKCQSMRDQTFQINAARLFNILPKYLRNLQNCGPEKFKIELDQFLSRIPDEPKVVESLTPGGCTSQGAASNSLLEQVERCRRDQGELRSKGS